MIFAEDGDRQTVSLLAVHRLHHFTDEFRRVRNDAFRLQLCPALLHGNLLQSGNSVGNRRLVPVHNLLPLGEEVGLVDRFLHLFFGQLHRDDVGKLKERRLQNRVGPAAQSCLKRQRTGVDGVKLHMAQGQSPLDGIRKLLFHLLRSPRTVQKEGAPIADIGQNVIFCQIGRHMARDKIRLRHKIRRMDLFFRKTKMRLREAAGFLGIVDKICLAVQVCRVADDFDRVLVGADRSVGTDTPENAAEAVIPGRDLLLTDRQGCEGDIVFDADREVVLRCLLLQIGEYGLDLFRRRVLGTQSIPASDNPDAASALLDDRADIRIERLTGCAGFLDAVQNGDALHGRRQCRKKMLRGERAVQVDVNESGLLSGRIQRINGQPRRIGCGSHEDHDLLGVRTAVIIKQMIASSDHPVQFVEYGLNSARYGLYVQVGRFLALEENIRIDRRAAGRGMLRIQGVLPESGDRLPVHQRLQFLVVRRFDLLNFMRRPETVKEMQERDPAVDRGQVGRSPQVHDLLYG